jgi:hypothetical protein
MKTTIAALALGGALVASAAWAQAPNARPNSATPFPQPSTSASNAPAASGSSSDAKVFPATSVLPAPSAVEDVKPPEMELPNEPIEPYLLTKENGPFMVMAKTFRGPDSERMALALCKELRDGFGLPAYILRTKDFPMRSHMRGTPPTAPSATMAAITRWPEKVRTFDEAAVLVGNEKTLAGSEALLHKVKKLHPKCLDRMHSWIPWREGGGLSRAIRTTNPYVPAQYLYPKTADRLVLQINSGLRSIANCPGHFSLQVAQFSGRTTFDLNPGRGGSSLMLASLRTSPLQTAHDDAERMADKLSKAPEIQRLGQPVYVFHDRTSSRVFVGSFSSEQDPAAYTTRTELVKHAVELTDQKKRGRAALDVMIAPATGLTNVNEMKNQLH